MGIKDLILIRGVSGSGKSTLMHVIDMLSRTGFNEPNRILTACADSYFINSVTVEYKFDPTKLPEAHKECQERVKKGIEEDKHECIIVHNTFTEEWEMKPYFDMAVGTNYQVTTIIVENRHGSKSRHEVPDEVIVKQKNKFDIKL